MPISEQARVGGAALLQLEIGEKLIPSRIFCGLVC